MKKYMLIVEDEFMILLKVEASKLGKSIKDFIIESVKKNIARQKTDDKNN
jgi:hypothetical protein